MPFKQTSESRGFLWVKNHLLLPEVLCCLVDVVWSADVYCSRKSVEILNMFSAKRASPIGWIQGLFELHMLLFIYTSKQSGKLVEEATGIQTQTHTHCLCTYTYVTELTLVLTLWNDCEPSRVCVARFNAHARTTLKTVWFEPLSQIHQVLIAHVGPCEV